MQQTAASLLLHFACVPHIQWTAVDALVDQEVALLLSGGCSRCSLDSAGEQVTDGTRYGTQRPTTGPNGLIPQLLPVAVCNKEKTRPCRHTKLTCFLHLSLNCTTAATFFGLHHGLPIHSEFDFVCAQGTAPWVAQLCTSSEVPARGDWGD